MSYQNRYKEAAFTPSGGERLLFSYEDVEVSVNKRGAAYQFPGFDGALVVDRGLSGRSFPLRIFIHGINYDLDAQAFIEALESPGVGVLEHPVYGAKNVVPLGSIKRTDGVKNQSGQAVIEVTFVETLLEIYPQSTEDLASRALLSVEAYTTSAAENFANTAVTAAPGFRTRHKSLIDSIDGELRTVANATRQVGVEFNEIKSDVDRALDVFITQPLNLGFQTLRLLQAPGRAVASVLDKLEASANLLKILLDRAFGSSNDLAVTGSLAYIATGLLNTRFDLKSDALTSANFLLEQFDTVVKWREANLTEDTSGVYDTLLEMVSSTAGYLIQISFTLKQEREIILDRPRNPLELTYELYKDVDQLNFFINSNNLSGDEIFELPMGRKCVYYV